MHNVTSTLTSKGVYMIYEYVMYFGYASIIASVAMTVVSAFEPSVTLRRKALDSYDVVALKHIGQRNILSGVVNYSNTETVEQ